MNDLRGYINPYIPGALTEEGQREGMIGDIYVENRRGRQITALISSVRKGTIVQVREAFYLAPATGDPRVRRRVMGERLDAIKERGGLILELGMRTVRCLSHARLLWAYEQIATSGRARKHSRPGRQPKWAFTKAEREVIEGLWTSRKYKTDAERTLAVQQRIGKPIARAWLRRHLGSPHGR